MEALDGVKLLKCTLSSLQKEGARLLVQRRQSGELVGCLFCSNVYPAFVLMRT